MDKSAYENKNNTINYAAKKLLPNIKIVEKYVVYINFSREKIAISLLFIVKISYHLI